MAAYYSQLQSQISKNLNLRDRSCSIFYNGLYDLPVLDRFVYVEHRERHNDGSEYCRISQVHTRANPVCG